MLLNLLYNIAQEFQRCFGCIALPLLGLLINNHSLIRKKNVRFIANGTVSVSTGGSVNPAFPAGIVVGDLLILQSYHRSSGQTIIGGVTGFTNIATDLDGGSFTRQYVYYKIADGTESGIMTITLSGGGVLSMARLSLFRGNAQTSPIEGLGMTTTNSVTVSHASIAGSRRGMAVALIGLSDDLTMAAYTGMTNGAWVEGYQNVSSSGDDGGIQMQYSPIGITSNVTGGTYTLSLSRVYIVRSFAIKPK